MRIYYTSSRFLAFAVIFGLCATYAPYAKSIDGAWWKNQAKQAKIPTVVAVALGTISGVTFGSIEEEILREKDNPPPISLATFIGGIWGIAAGAATGLIVGAINKGPTGALKGLFRGAISGGLTGAATGATVFGITSSLKKIAARKKQPTHENIRKQSQKPLIP